MTPRHVAVIGGGITGLAAAWFLLQGDRPPQVSLLEAAPRLGGKLQTGHLDGLTVEEGADAFLAREPQAADLCRRLGLGPDLVAPAVSEVQVWSRGGLHRLPDGLVAGVPARLTPLLRSRLLSARGVARAALDLVLARQVDLAEASVGELVTHRFGRELAERVVEPLLAGVYAGDLDRLSVTAATPELAAAAAAHRSVLVGLRARRLPEGPLFLTVRGGLARLVGRLEDDLQARGAAVRTNTPVRLIERVGDGYRLQLAAHKPPERIRDGYRLQQRAHEPLAADAVVLAVPAYSAAELLRDAAPAAAEQLRGIAYASVATVVLVYPQKAGSLPGSGMLVARVEGRLTKSATWLSHKWPHLVRDGRMVIRVSVGRHRDDSPLRLSDDELVVAVHEELQAAVRLTAGPATSRVIRWECALPQYELGHLQRLRIVEQELAGLPGLALAGAAYRGVGITACVRQAADAARRVLAAGAHGAPRAHRQCGTGPSSQVR